MEGIPAAALAAAWSAAMAAVALAAAAIVARRVPPEPGPRILAFIAVEGIALAFFLPAVLVCFIWPEAFGLAEDETGAFIVVVIAFALLVAVLMLWLVVVPLLRRRGAANDPGSPPSGTVRR